MESTKKISGSKNIKKCSLNSCSIKFPKELSKYKYKKVLGEGGFGTTVLMENSEEKIAVKVIENNSEMIENEISILKKLQNECSKKRVLCYREKINHDNSTFIITEFIEGISLKEYEFSKDSLLFYKFFGQLIDAVEYINSIGIVHFDIKPENIMISKDDNLKLIDFGGASSQGIDGMYTITAYTPYFSKNGELDTYKLTRTQSLRYDIYSVCVTIWFILIKNKDKIPYDLKKLCKLKKDELKENEFLLEIKKVIDSHIDSKSKNFLHNGFKASVRNLLTLRIRRSTI